MATIKPVSFNRLPEIDENDGKVILHDGSQLGRSTKELGEIIDDRLRTGLEDGKQYAMTTSGWKDVVIPEVDLTPYAYSAGLEADKQFVMTDNGWAEVDLSPYALSADVDSKAEEISAWANETFLSGVDLSDYALSADVDTIADEIFEWANNTFVTSANLEDDTQYVMTTSGWGEVTIPEQVQSDWEEDDPESPAYILNKPVSAEIIGDDKTVKLIPGENNQYTVSALYEGKYVPLSAIQCTIGIGNTNMNQGVSLSQGFNNTVQNDNAFAQGTSNTVSQQSLAQGIANTAYNNSFAQGGGAYADTFSFAQGNGITANNTAMVQGRNSYSDTESLAVGENVSAVSYSLAVGYKNRASQGSIAVGLNNISRGNGFTQGNGNSALGEYSVAIGLQNSANSYYTFTTGRENSAAGEDAIAMGQSNYAARRYTFAVGLGNSAINGHAIALGQNNIVSGEFGVALSQLNSAFGDNSFVVGYKSRAKGRYADAIGFQNSAIGEYSFVAGCTSKAYTNAISIGTYNDASGTNSVAIGHGVSAKQDDQTVLGKYNEISNDASDLLIVGNGSDSSHTSNAFVIKATGIASATNMMTTAGYVVVSADVTATDTQYAMTTSGWQPTVNLVPGTGIVFREGTGVDEGKTFVEVDSTNYKLLTTEEYNSLTAVIDTVSTYSASWVLTNN